jgi:hypothetical protein
MEEYNRLLLVAESLTKACEDITNLSRRINQLAGKLFVESPKSDACAKLLQPDNVPKSNKYYQRFAGYENNSMRTIVFPDYCEKEIEAKPDTYEFVLGPDGEEKRSVPHDFSCPQFYDFAFPANHSDGVLIPVFGKYFANMK